MTEQLSAPHRLIDYASKPPLAETNSSAGHLRNYDLVYRCTSVQEGASGLEHYLSTYNKLGVEHVVVKARDVETTFGIKIRNEDVAEFCARHGPRYIGFAGVDPHKGMQAVRELERGVKELGLRGLNIQCFEHKLSINDKLMYPLYAKCVELDVPVNVHCGINFSTQSTMAYGQPYLLDEVLMHFPELRVCAAPPGWPWVQELLGVAWKHPSLFIGLVMVKPKLLAVPNSGYESLLQYGRTLLKDRIIFGSGFPRLSPTDAVREVDALNLSDDVKDRWLYRNAKRFLRL